MFNFFKKPKAVNSSPQEWIKKVYATTSEVNLWSLKLNYDDYLKAIKKYNERSPLPSEEDLKNPASFTRGIFVALDKNIIFSGGFDYEYGYEELFKTLERLFQKAKINFHWKEINDSSYIYEINNSKYELDLSQDEDPDTYEVSGDTFIEIESNINKSLQTKNLYLVHTYTGDQTCDYVLISKENFQKLKEIFPNTEDYQVIIDGQVQNL